MREVQFQSVCTWGNSAELLLAVLKNIWQSITIQNATVLCLDLHKDLQCCTAYILGWKGVSQIVKKKHWSEGMSESWPFFQQHKDREGPRCLLVPRAKRYLCLGDFGSRCGCPEKWLLLSPSWVAAKGDALPALVLKPGDPLFSIHIK